MSLTTFFQKVDADVAKIAPAVDAVLPVLATLIPSTAGVVSAAKGVIAVVAAEGPALETDLETLWSSVEGAVTDFTNSLKGASSTAPAASTGTAA